MVKPWAVKLVGLVVAGRHRLSRFVCPGCRDDDLIWYRRADRRSWSVQPGKPWHHPRSGRVFPCRSPVRHLTFGDVWSMEWRVERFWERFVTQYQAILRGLVE